jgi:hypothetical protein
VLPIDAIERQLMVCDWMGISDLLSLDSFVGVGI